MIHCDSIIFIDEPMKDVMRPSRVLNDKKFQTKKFPLGYKRDPVDERDYKFTSLVPSLLESIKTLPIVVDHTPDMSPVKNQGQLGSCVGFAVSAMKEAQEKKEHEEELAKGKPGRKKEYNYSESWIYWNSKKIDPWPNEEGTSIRFAMQVLNKKGVPTEKAWPYKDVGDIGQPENWAKMVARWALIGSYWRINNLLELKTALVDGPVPIGVPCFYEIFFIGSDGIVPYPENPRVMYGGHAVCLSEDTKVPLLNGNEYNMKQLSILYPEKKFWVYSCDNDGNIVAGLAHSPRKTGVKKVLKVTLDNGESFKCTHDHKILSRNGEYIEAQNLEVNDSIMPLYKKKGIGDYEMVYNPSIDEWLYTHKIMCNNKINSGDKKVVHHKNFNKYDNSPENLQEMTWDDHVKLHSKFANPEPIIKYAKSDVGRNKSRVVMNDNWSSEKFRNKMKNICINNGKITSQKLTDEGRCGFQNFSKEQMQEFGRENGLKNHIYLNTKESHEKAGDTFHNRYINDEEFNNEVVERSRNNIKEYNMNIKEGKIKPTEKQIEVRKKNGNNINKNMTDEQRKLRGLKTAYTRWYKDKFNSFKDFLEYKGIAFNNHKVISIEECGYEDVYDLTVEKYHNFAIDSGIFVHNCAVGYDDNKQLIKFKNSWGRNWGEKGYGYLSYQYINDFLWDAWAAKDISVTREMLEGTRTLV